jgi:hypothetical protein
LNIEYETRIIFKSCEFYVVNTQVDKKVAVLGLQDSVKLGIVKRLLEINEKMKI